MDGDGMFPGPCLNPGDSTWRLSSPQPTTPKIGRDKRVGPRFWYLDTSRHRWSIRIHFWLHRANWLRLNRQPSFSEILIGRCIDLCRSDRGRT